MMKIERFKSKQSCLSRLRERMDVSFIELESLVRLLAIFYCKDSWCIDWQTVIIELHLLRREVSL